MVKKNFKTVITIILFVGIVTGVEKRKNANNGFEGPDCLDLICNNEILLTKMGQIVSLRG